MVGDHQDTFGEGRIYLLGPGLPHNFYHLSKAKTKPAYTDRRVIRFHTNLIRDIELSVPELRAFSRLLDKAGRGLMFHGKCFRKVSPIINRLTSRKNDAGLDSFLMFLKILDALSSDENAVTLAGEYYRPPQKSVDVERIDVICNYLLKNINRHVMLEKVAAKVNMSISNLCAFFRKSTGTTVIAYVNRIRIGHACSLLIETNLPVIDVSAESGFRTLSHFNRQFKRIKGTTPMRFRQKKQGLVKF